MENWASGIGHRASGIGHRASGIGDGKSKVQTFFILPSSFFTLDFFPPTSSFFLLPSSSLTDRFPSFRRAENAPVRGGLLA